MDKLIYTVMTGAERAFHAQQVHANNLANADTQGFRADYEVASAQAVQGYGYDTRHQSVGATDAVVQRSGTVTTTGRSLDVAIRGEGYLAVRFGDGEAYTRAGAMELDANGALSIHGRPVMGDGGPIVLPPHRAVSIASDGTISVLPEDGQDMQEVDRLKLVQGQGAVTKNAAGLIVARDGNPLPASETVRLQGQALEGSNVRAVEEMVAVMDVSRQFEIQMKLFQAADSMVDAGNRLVRD
jgi:flagellar basal-body rod protein FlgF